MRKGFTLIELLIVIAIIAILAAIAIPQFARYRRRAYNSAALSDLDQIKLTSTTYSTDYMVFPDIAALSNDSIDFVDASGNAVNAPAHLYLKLTKGVYADGAQSATGASATYVTAHLQGDEEYGYDTDGTAVYYQSINPGDAASIAAPAATDNAVDFAAPWREK